MEHSGFPYGTDKANAPRSDDRKPARPGKSTHRALMTVQVLGGNTLVDRKRGSDSLTYRELVTYPAPIPALSHDVSAVHLRVTPQLLGPTPTTYGKSYNPDRELLYMSAK